MLNRHRRDRGVALITVMFIMVLLTTLVAYMIEDEYLAIRRAANQQDSEQGFQIAVYAEQWARKVLELDGGENETDYSGEIWNTRVATLPETDDVALHTRVTDLQGRFNLNNLAAGKDDTWYPAFQRLLAVLELDPGLADAVADWVDADINVSGHNGAEDAEYLLEEPPYRSANRPLVIPGELIWIKGMTDEALDALGPHVTALPATDVPINVNTATVELMRILTPTILDDSRAASLIEGRGEEGYADTNAFLTRTALAGQGDTVERLITVRSEYFEVYSRVENGRYPTVLHSVIRRDPDSRQTSVIQRQRGV